MTAPTSKGVTIKKPRTASTKKPPLISIIIPVYNAQSTLERCFDSIISQSYHNLEIILVDDGSTDDSGRLCDELSVRDTRVIVVHQTNQGTSAARNRGLALAQGEYLTFVDPDDTIDPELISTLYDLLIAYRVKLSICSFTEVFSNDQHRAFAKQHQPELYSSAEALVRLLCETGFMMSVWGKLYARELFHDIKFPVGKLYEDVDVTYRLILKCNQVAFTPQSYYNYYQNSGSAVHQAFRHQKLDLIELTDTMCDNIAASQTFRNASSPERQQLEFALLKRRMHARFSILRQLTGNTTSEKQLRKELTAYIRSHANDILKNPLHSRRDVIATRAVQLNPHLFQLLWKLHSRNQ